MADCEESPTQKVAKMLVDHFVQFKGCEHHAPVTSESGMSLREFVERRNELLQQIPEFGDPDFAQPNMLPVNARLPDDPKEEVEDEWNKLSGKPLTSMPREEWNHCYETIERVFTGTNPSGDDQEDDDEPVEINRNLEIGKGDMMFDESELNRKLAKGKLRLDIDSVLAVFTDLTFIKTVLNISIVPLPTKNLQNDVHIVHNGVALHWIPHFHLGTFGHDPTFDLFIFLPALYNKGLKRRKNSLFNHVPEKVIAEFMNMCLLPAIEKVLDDGESQEWDFDYELNKVKSNAVGIEGHIHSSERERFRQRLHFDLDADHIAPVWKICSGQLKRKMRHNQHLKAFKGFQFFINMKNYKYRSGVKLLSELDQVYESKV